MQSMQTSGSSDTVAEHEEEAFLNKNPNCWGLDMAQWNLSGEGFTDKEGTVLIRLLVRMGPKLTYLV